MPVTSCHSCPGRLTTTRPRRVVLMPRESQCNCDAYFICPQSKICHIAIVWIVWQSLIQTRINRFKSQTISNDGNYGQCNKPLLTSLLLQLWKAAAVKSLTSLSSALAICRAEIMKLNVPHQVARQQFWPWRAVPCMWTAFWMLTNAVHAELYIAAQAFTCKVKLTMLWDPKSYFAAG